MLYAYLVLVRTNGLRALPAWPNRLISYNTYISCSQYHTSPFVKSIFSLQPQPPLLYIHVHAAVSYLGINSVLSCWFKSSIATCPLPAQLRCLIYIYSYQVTVSIYIHTSYILREYVSSGTEGISAYLPFSPPCVLQCYTWTGMIF